MEPRIKFKLVVFESKKANWEKQQRKIKQIDLITFEV